MAHPFGLRPISDRSVPASGPKDWINRLELLRKGPRWICWSIPSWHRAWPMKHNESAEGFLFRSIGVLALEGVLENSLASSSFGKSQKK